MSATIASRSPSRAELQQLLEDHLCALGLREVSRVPWRRGLGTLLDWLASAPGATWQQRWEALGAEQLDDWRAAAGAHTLTHRQGLASVLQALLCHRLLRPGYPWLLSQPFDGLREQLHTTTDRADFERLFATGTANGMNARMATCVGMAVARMLVHTGKQLGELTTDDFVAYATAWRHHRHGKAGRAGSGLLTAHQLLRAMGIIADPPLTVGFDRRQGQRSAAELLAGRPIASGRVRGLLLRYLQERAASLDHASVRQLEICLVKLFWLDLEAHHPGIDSIRLPADVAQAWKDRARVLPDGRPRRDVHSLFTVVRSFYRDLARWAAEDPSTWGPWVAPPPITEEDLRAHGKAKHRRRARMHARIRTLGPHLPALLTAARQRLDTATELLDAAHACPGGQEFALGGRRYRRVPVTTQEARAPGVPSVRVQCPDEPGRPRLNCQAEEDDAFWAWAVIEVLRLTGIRCEELLELTHTAIRPYRMRDGQVVVLLQIVPSKTDRERLIPVCPELAHALARITARARGNHPTIPTVARWDPHEKVMSPPLPYLLQRQRGGNRVLLTRHSLTRLLDETAVWAGLRDVDGAPLSFQPHDFRRLFATDAVNGGLPVHIAAKVFGHLDLSTTQGYVAVYDEQVIRHVQAHVARRRALRPSEEYREPTAAEWAEFEQHFRRRKLALGDCYRPYGTDCPHEHACVRCPMLRMDPHQLPRLLAIEQDTHRLLGEARANGWDGEALGLEATLQVIVEKKAQVERLQRQATPTGSDSRQLVWVALEPKQPASR